MSAAAAPHGHQAPEGPAAPRSSDAGAPFGSTGAATREPIVTMDCVTKTYRSARGEETVALLPVDDTVIENEFLSLVGPSGCGKTTLLKMCAGLITPTDGAVTFKDTGRPVRPGSFGMVFQNAALLPWRTVLDNVVLPADVLRLPKREARERALDLLELVRLSGAAGKYPAELSGGMQQRVAIARALLHDPDILFMDEPFGALDAMTREELNMELQRIHTVQTKTIVFVTHSITEAVLMSDRILVFSSGPGEVIARRTVPLSRPRGAEDPLSFEFRELEADIRSLLERRRDVGDEGGRE